MKQPVKKLQRAWRASLIRKWAERLGTVWAPDREAAEVAAVKEFGLSEEQRKRLRAIYFYFDNDQAGYAAQNALTLKRMVAEKLGIPEPRLRAA